METPARPWHHRPSHVFDPGRSYILTAGTLDKVLLFQGEERLCLLRDTLADVASSYGWQLQAWAILANHYHFVAQAPEDASSLRPMLQRLHSQTARGINRLDDKPGRRVWFQYWDTCITFEKSYLARLRYVHYNAVKHGVVAVAADYPYCSAAWFEQSGESAFVRKVQSYECERVNVVDDF
ncbi:MAG: transposase [Thermoanaerobaculaceae bacterium]|nr:transposase [Thermoanaerobaculaceae bacterium]